VTGSMGSDGTVTVTWRDNSSNESRFEVLRANDAGTDVFFLYGSVAANVTSYRDTGVGASSAYCYRVRAVRVKGQSSTASALSASACMPAALVAPSNVTVSATTETSIELAWQDNTAEETRFEVFRSSGPDVAGTLAGSTAANVTTYLDAGLTPGTTYCYTIVAVREVDGSRRVSPPSSVRCASTLAIAPAPTVARVTGAVPFTSTWVDVYWEDASTSVEETSRLYRSRDGGVTWELVQTVVGGSRWGAYDTGLEPERPACYRVVNSTRAGTAEPSNTLCTTPPAAPSDVIATVVDASSVDVTWRDNSAVEDGYEVRAHYGSCTYDDVYGLICDDGWTALATLPANATSYRAPLMSGLEFNGWRVYPMKDLGYGSGTSANQPPASP
jgi:fibronectin type 3 domain-containing protein